MLIINADDWGGWPQATDAAWSCFVLGRITSVSAMVFMADSERAADLAKGSALDIGLHINFNEPLTGSNVPSLIRNSHTRIMRFLRSNRYAQLFYNPWLRHDFRCVHDAQLMEFLRLYGREPSHVDGHQHMHLCANMILQRVIARGHTVRRNFSFWPGEKSIVNRLYRRCLDGWLLRYYRSTRYFFSLAQSLKIGTVPRIAELAGHSTVELMTHPEHPAEYCWLTGSTFDAAFGRVRLASHVALTGNLTHHED